VYYVTCCYILPNGGTSVLLMCTTDLIENDYMESFSRKGGATTVR
jgi:hypothetical protein